MLDIDFLTDATGDEVLPEATRRSIADLPLMLDPGSTDDLNKTVLDSSVESLSSNLTTLADLFDMLVRLSVLGGHGSEIKSLLG